MASLQSAAILGHEQRTSPSAHTVYKIQIHASVRSWFMWRRYSEFVDLDQELFKLTGAHPPADIPPKHSFSIRRKFNEDAIIKERISALEAYLRAIIGSKDARWRDAYPFRDFLGVPISKHSLDEDNGGANFTNSSWLDEHTDLQSLVRDIRADLNKRDSLGDRGEVSASANANVQAKKKLTTLVKRMNVLAKALEALGSSGMTQGELHRRAEMVARLQDDTEKLSKIVVAARPRAAAAPAASEARAELLAPPNSSSPSRPVTRVFGAAPAPKETNETRPLDDEGLFQLQQQQMEQQDTQVAQISAIVSRQKQLAVAIGNELEEQNTILDGLNEDVDKFGVKMGKARKQLNRLE